jgi:hypothetical protein
MKRIIFSLLVTMFYLSIYAQHNYKNDSIIKLFQESVLKRNHAQFAVDFEKTFIHADSLTQLSILNYFSQYSIDSLLYLHIDQMRALISEFFYKSSSQTVRKKATNLLLETYRLSQYSYDEPICWYPKAKRTDFDEEAKYKVIKILQGEPFSKIELDLWYKYELYSSRQHYYNDTLEMRKYRKKTKNSMRNLQDSLAIAEAKSNIRNLQPSRFVSLSLCFLASWLDMENAIPYIEEDMNTWNSKLYPAIYQGFKLPLARLGNKLYESELLDSMLIKKYLDFHILGFISTPKTIDIIIQGLKMQGRPKGKTSGLTNEGKWIEAETEGEPYNCFYLRELIYKNLITNFPFKFDGLSLAMCEISNEDIARVVDWLERNRDRIVLNRDYH